MMKKIVLLLITVILGITSFAQKSVIFKNLKVTNEFNLVPKDVEPYPVSAAGTLYLNSGSGLWRSNGTLWLQDTLSISQTLNTVTDNGNITNNNIYISSIDDQVVGSTTSSPKLYLRSYSNSVNFGQYYSEWSCGVNGYEEYTFSVYQGWGNITSSDVIKFHADGTIIANTLEPYGSSPLGSAPSGTDAISGTVLTANGTGGSSWMAPASSTIDIKGELLFVERLYTSAEILADQVPSLYLVPAVANTYYILDQAYIYKEGDWSVAYIGGNTTSIEAGINATGRDVNIALDNEFMTNIISSVYGAFFVATAGDIANRNNVRVNVPISFLLSGFTTGTGDIRIKLFYRAITI